jgi:hypothetical protein
MVTGMSSQRSITAADLLAHMRHYKRRWPASVLSRHLSTTADHIRDLLAILIQSGEVSVDVDGERYYHLTAHGLSRAVPAKQPVDVVPPFKANLWTPPMQGYTERMKAAAARALATRRP